MNTIVLIYMLLQAKVVAVEAFYSIGLKIVSLPCNPKNCKHMTICYNLINKCGSDRKTSKICLSNVIDNEININTISAMNGTIGFNVDEVKRDLKIQSRLYLTLSQIGKGDDIYCEESRNVSGNIMAFHLTKLNSFIDIELESVCEEKKCTGFICDRCYDGPPDVNISVIQPVRRDDNVTIVCDISLLTEDTRILWLVTNGTVSNAIYHSDKYNIKTSKSTSSSYLTIYSVQHEDELNYTCQATNVIYTGESSPMQLNVFENPVANISDIAPAKAGTNITISCYIPSSSKATHITWMKDDVIINITRNEKFGGGTLSSPSLQIYRLRLADEGNYTCQATNPIGIGRSQPVLLTVISDPPVVSISEIKPAVIGTNITLICNITSFTEEINVTWFKNNVSLNIKHTDKSHFIGGPVFFRTLTINFLEVKDGGDYTCKATNEAGDGLSEPLHLRLFENITKGTSSLHTSGPYIFSSYPSYSPETKHPMESSKTTYLSSAERTIISQSSSKIPVPTSSVKYVEPTNSVQTSATTLINIQPSSTSLTLQANSDNRTNVNAWIITTVVICIVELIVITLVVYIVWLRKKHKFTEEMNRKIREQELAMMDNLTFGTQSVILDNGTYRGTPSYIMDNGTLRTQRSILPLYATMGRYRSTLIETDKVHRDNIPVILNGGPRTEPSPVMEHPTPEENHYTEINKVRKDNIPAVANGSVPKDNISVISNGVLISDGKEQTEKEKVSRDESPVIPNKIIHSDQTPVMCNDNLISDGKEQTEKEKVSRDESPVIPNKMLLKEPSDETVNELEVTSF